MSQKKPSRKEARIARKNAKQLANQGKQVRLQGRPVPEKTPRVNIDLNSIYQMNMTWCITKIDEIDSWSWGQERKIEETVFSGEIEPKLNEFRKLTWSEIEQHASGGHRMHHAQDVASIIPEAQDRWSRLYIETQQAYRFRLTGQQRVWGYREAAHFYFVWYDPKHKIYPVEKKHT